MRVPHVVSESGGMPNGAKWRNVIAIPTLFYFHNMFNPIVEYQVVLKSQSMETV